MYSCSKLGDSLPPSGSKVIPKAWESFTLLKANILVSSVVNLSSIPKLVGVNGSSFKDQTWYTFPLGGVGKPATSIYVVCFVLSQ